MELSEEILGFDDLRTKQVTVKEWGNKTLSIREPDLHQVLKSREMVVDGDVQLRALEIAQTVASSVIDEHGDRVFSDDQVPRLARKNRHALMFLYNEILALAGTLEDAEKN